MKSQNRNKRKIFINTFHMTYGSVIEKLLLFFGTVLIARYLSIEHYGVYTTALGLATFFSMFTNLNLNMSIIKTIGTHRNHQDEFFTASLFIKSILSIAVYLSIIITLMFAGYGEDAFYLTLILGIIRIAGEFINTSYAYYEANEKFKITALLISTFSFLLLIGTILVIFIEGNYYDLVSVRLFITLLFLLLLFFLLRKDYHLKFDFKIVKNFIREMLPFSGSFAVQNVMSNCGIIILPLMHGTIYAGLYQNAFLIIISTTFIFSNLLRVITPFLYKHPFSSNKDKFQFTFDVYSKIFSAVSFYLLIIFFIYSQDIISLIFGNKYNDSIRILKIFAFSLLNISVAQTIITTLGKQKVNTLIDTISAIFNIILSYFFIYYYKAEGAAIAYVITYFLNYVMSNGYLIKKKYIKYQETFKIKIKLIIFSIIIFIFHILLSFKFQFFVSIIIDSLIYIILVICFILKKDDIRIIKEIFIPNK